MNTPVPHGGANKMNRPVKIPLQTTIPAAFDDWSIARCGLLVKLLREQKR
jgi:hypothetical protein